MNYSEAAFRPEIQSVVPGRSNVLHILISQTDVDDNAVRPNLFLLDLNLPTRTGEEVLARIRNSRELSTTPVVVMTSSDSPKNRAIIESLGASRLFCKPSDYDSFIQLGELIEEILTST